MTNEAVFNLSAFAERLLREKRKVALAFTIKNAVDSRSLQVDLIFSLEACDALAFSLDNRMDQPADFRETSEAALMSYIVLLYARATKTESEVRKQYDPRSRFTAAELKVHKELCDLRDNAVAHFGTGGSYVGDWVRELAVMDVVDFVARPAIITRRLIVDRPLLTRARAQITRALEIIRPVCVKRMKALTDEIDKECAADPEFYKEVHQHPLNAVLFLGGEEQAARMRQGRAQGQARGAFGHD